jgi:hypothetical protein
MDLPEKAARALGVLRRDGRALRYTVEEVCHTGRHRLSVRYLADDGNEVRLGLLYSDDREGLEALRGRLAMAPVPG